MNDLKELHCRLVNLQMFTLSGSKEYREIGKQIRDLEHTIDPERKSLFGRIIHTKRAMPGINRPAYQSSAISTSKSIK